MRNIILKFIGLIYLLLIISCDGIEPIDVPIDGIIKIKLLGSNMDTLSTEVFGSDHQSIFIKIEVPSNTDNSFRNVTLTTSDGRFSDSKLSTVTKSVDSDGTLIEKLDLPISSKTINISATVGTAPNHYINRKTFNFNQVETILYLKLYDETNDTSPINLPADNHSLYRLKSSVLIENSFITTIVLSTTGGSFVNSNEKTLNLDINENNEVETLIKLPQSIDKFFTRVALKDNPEFFVEIPIQPTPAYPKEIIIEPEKLTYTLEDMNMINVYLQRPVGKVSLETEVTINAYQIQDNNSKLKVGRFNNLQNRFTDSNEHVTFTFLTDTQDIDTLKNIYIEASAIKNADQDTIFESIELFFK